MSGHPSTLTDAELVERCRAGDTDAWNELVERFSRYVYAVTVKGFRLGAEDAEDVYQEVFTRVYTHLGTLRDDSAVRPSITQLTRRLCLDTIAKSGREQPAADPISAEIAADLDAIEEALTIREALTTLPRALSGGARPLLRPRPELSHHLERARAALPERSRAASPAASEDCARSSREEVRPLRGLGSRWAAGGIAKRGWASSCASCDPPRKGGLGLRRSCRGLAARSTRSSPAPRRALEFRAALIAALEVALEQAGYEPDRRVVSWLEQRLAPPPDPA